MTSPVSAAAFTTLYGRAKTAEEDRRGTREAAPAAAEPRRARPSVQAVNAAANGPVDEVHSRYSRPRPVPPARPPREDPPVREVRENEVSAARERRQAAAYQPRAERAPVQDYSYTRSSETGAGAYAAAMRR